MTNAQVRVNPKTDRLRLGRSWVPMLKTLRVKNPQPGTTTYANWLPAGALVLNVFGLTKVDLNGTTPTVNLGDGTTADRYFATANLDEETAAAVGVTAGPEYSAAAEDVVVTAAGVGLTTGEIHYVFEYVLMGPLFVSPEAG